MRYRVSYDLSLVIVEGRVPCSAVLAGYWVAYCLPCEAVIVRTPDVDECAGAGVVVGYPDVEAIGGYPWSVGLGEV